MTPPHVRTTPRSGVNRSSAVPAAKARCVPRRRSRRRRERREVGDDPAAEQPAAERREERRREEEGRVREERRADAPAAVQEVVDHRRLELGPLHRAVDRGTGQVEEPGDVDAPDHDLPVEGRSRRVGDLLGLPQLVGPREDPERRDARVRVLPRGPEVDEERAVGVEPRARPAERHGALLEPRRLAGDERRGREGKGRHGPLAPASERESASHHAVDVGVDVGEREDAWPPPRRAAPAAAHVLARTPSPARKAPPRRGARRRPCVAGSISRSASAANSNATTLAAVLLQRRSVVLGGHRLPFEGLRAPPGGAARSPRRRRPRALVEVEDVDRDHLAPGRLHQAHRLRVERQVPRPGLGDLRGAAPRPRRGPGRARCAGRARVRRRIRACARRWSRARSARRRRSRGRTRAAGRRPAPSRARRRAAAAPRGRPPGGGRRAWARARAPRRGPPSRGGYFVRPSEVRKRSFLASSVPGRPLNGPYCARIGWSAAARSAGEACEAEPCE